MSALSLAVEMGEPAVLDLLLKHGGDPNLRGPDGDSLLHLAALRQRKDQLEVLLKHGADVNSYNAQFRSTAGNVAAAMGRFDIVLYLLESGLNYELRELAKSVELAKVPPNSEQYRLKKKVLDVLKNYR
jgi:ankyrin repeat protein